MGNERRSNEKELKGLRTAIKGILDELTEIQTNIEELDDNITALWCYYQCLENCFNTLEIDDVGDERYTNEVSDTQVDLDDSSGASERSTTGRCNSDVAGSSGNTSGPKVPDPRDVSYWTNFGKFPDRTEG